MFVFPFANLSAVAANVTILMFPMRYYMEFNAAYFMKDSMEHFAWF
jgi:hypothetical protein